MIGESTLRLAGFLSDCETRSGQTIARELGCTRAAVWKQIETLRQLGIGVNAVAGQGYRLSEPLELLDREKILAVRGTAFQAELRQLDILSEIDSTNSELLRRGAGHRHSCAVIAERQTGGRGRRGRQWHSPFGRNIYLSLGWKFESGLGQLGCLPLVVAISASSALLRMGLRGRTIKWPNDLLLEGRKIGGCLVEVQGDLNGPCHAVMGVGINVRMPDIEQPKSIGRAWTDVSSHIAGASRNELAALLLDELVKAMTVYRLGGFEPFREAWAGLDELKDKPVTLFRDQKKITGIARGLGERGGLLLERSGVVDEFHAGEVREPLIYSGRSRL